MPSVLIEGSAGYIYSQDAVLANAYAGAGSALVYLDVGSTTIVRCGVRLVAGPLWTAYQMLFQYDLSAYAWLRGKITSAYLIFGAPSGTYNLVTDHLMEVREYDFGVPAASDWVLPANIAGLGPILFSMDSSLYTPSGNNYITLAGSPAAQQAISDACGGTLKLFAASDDVRLQTALADASYMGFWNEWAVLYIYITYQDTAPVSEVC